MELKLYLRILLRKWWLVAAAVILTVIPTYLYVNQQPWIYEARATFVIRPRTSFEGDSEGFVKAIDTLSNRVAINTTFAQVASSRLIKAQAMDALGLSANEREGLKVSSRVIAGTNVLEISVQGLDPAIVRDVTEAVSLETVDYIGGLYDVFQLEPLDMAEQSSRPVSPNKTLNIAVGAFLGLLLGVSLVFLLEYLRTPESKDLSFNVIDHDTGIYNKTYFMLRLRQEIRRAQRNNYVLTLALLEVNDRGITSGAFRQVPVNKASAQIAVALGPILRDEDILAHLGDSIFALLLPDMTGEEAKELLEEVRVKIGLLSSTEESTEKGLTVYSTIGIATYQQGEIDEEALLVQAAEALTEAGTAIYGKVSLYAPQARVEHQPQGVNGNGIELLDSERALSKA